METVSPPKGDVAILIALPGPHTQTSVNREEPMLPGGRKPLEEHAPSELWELFITDETLQLAVDSTNKRVEYNELMKTRMYRQPVAPEETAHARGEEACVRLTHLKKNQAWPPKSAGSLSKVPLTDDELRKNVAVEYYTSMVWLPTTTIRHQTRIKHIISRGRFYAIQAMLSLESAEDTLEARDNKRHREVRVWLDMFNARNKYVAETYCTPEQLQSSMAVEEQLTLCKSETAKSLRMPNKPVKQGYKIFSIDDTEMVTHIGSLAQSEQLHDDP